MSKYFKDKKIQIYVPFEHIDKIGQYIPDAYYPLYEKPIWAYTRLLKSEEEFDYGTSFERYVQEFRINYHPEITRGMFVYYNSIWYRISYIDDYEGGKHDLKLVTENPYGRTPEDILVADYDQEKVKKFFK